MEDVGDTLEVMLSNKMQSSTPAIPMYSTVFGRVLTENDQLDSRYWRQNLQSPVLFSTATQEALNAIHGKSSCFVEIGPHCPLSGPLQQIFRGANSKTHPHYVPTLHKSQDQAVDVLEAAGQMFLKGFGIDLFTINGKGNVLTDLPPYPWHYTTKLWRESRVSKGWRFRGFPKHELLGSRTLESNDIEPTWRNILSLENSPWLCDHKFSGAIVFPGAGYIATAGEAIRQITGATGYSIQNLFIRNALFLDLDSEVEIMTSLSSTRLSNILDSDQWYDFKISSFNGEQWTKHCTGQIGAFQRSKSTLKPAGPFIREVECSKWYQSLKALGIEYGPYFQGMDKVTADPLHSTAVGLITTKLEIPEFDTYTVHPTTIDKCLQLLTVAATRGISRKLDQLAVPISIEKVSIVFCDDLEVSAEASCCNSADSNFEGDVFAVSGNEKVVDIEGVQCFAMEAESIASSSNFIWSARVEWQADIKFCGLDDALESPTRHLVPEIRDMEAIVALQIMRVYGSVKDMAPTETHLAKYQGWLKKQMKRLQQGENAHVPQAQEWMVLDVEQERNLLASLSEQFKSNPADNMHFLDDFIRTVADSVLDIFQGKKSSLEVLMEEDWLERFYTTMSSTSNYQSFLSKLGHANPTMKVLEIGAGTGGMTAVMLEGLQTPGGAKMYSEYVFTDISSGFFPAAKEKFKQAPGLKFKALDITKDPQAQGFEAYDLVTCSNVCLPYILFVQGTNFGRQVLHATPSLHDTLVNVRKLLKPGGHLLLEEICTGRKSMFSKTKVTYIRSDILYVDFIMVSIIRLMTQSFLRVKVLINIHRVYFQDGGLVKVTGEQISLMYL
jgi:acyl transferase domain-containing protein